MLGIGSLLSAPWILAKEYVWSNNQYTYIGIEIMITS